MFLDFVLDFVPLFYLLTPDNVPKEYASSESIYFFIQKSSVPDHLFVSFFFFFFFFFFELNNQNELIAIKIHTHKIY